MEERVKRLLPETLPTVTILRGHHDPRLYLAVPPIFGNRQSLWLGYNFTIRIVCFAYDFLLVIITFGELASLFQVWKPFAEEAWDNSWIGHVVWIYKKDSRRRQMWIFKFNKWLERVVLEAWAILVTVLSFLSSFPFFRRCCATSAVGYTQFYFQWITWKIRYWQLTWKRRFNVRILLEAFQLSPECFINHGSDN